MAQRSIWRGHLRLALVSCPVALYSVREAAGDLHFHLINPETGHRVRMITVDAETEEEVSRQKLAKGYEFEKDRYVLLDDADFNSARIESSSTIEVEKFVPADAIDPIFFDTSYYMAPDGKAGRDIYVVLRDAISKTKCLALSRVVVSQRERVIAISPMGGGLVVHTLHELHDVREATGVFGSVPQVKPDPEMVDLAIQLIDRQTGKFDPEVMQDRYEMRLREVIKAKLGGKTIQPTAEVAEGGGNVIDLMAALKRSLGGEAATSRSVAKKKAVSPRPPKNSSRTNQSAKKRKTARG